MSSFAAASAPAPAASDASLDDIYDRQIRLWGKDSQSKMQSASLYFMNVTSVSAELCKNLVLAGLSVTLFDNRVVTPAMVGGHLFLRPEDVGLVVSSCVSPRIQELNPHVLVSVAPCPSFDAALSDLRGRGAPGTVVVASRLDGKSLCLLSDACRDVNAAFVVVDSFGFEACAVLCPPTPFTYQKEVGKDKLSDPITVTFPTIREVLNIDNWSSLGDRFGPVSNQFLHWSLLVSFASHTGVSWPLPSSSASFPSFASSSLASHSLSADLLPTEHLQRLAAVASSELAPVSAAFGGLVGQEVIKIISGKGEPANNVMVFDGMEGSCKVFRAPK